MSKTKTSCERHKDVTRVLRQSTTRQREERPDSVRDQDEDEREFGNSGAGRQRRGSRGVTRAAARMATMRQSGRYESCTEDEAEDQYGKGTTHFVKVTEVAN